MATSFSWIHGNALTIESPVHFNEVGEQNGRLILTPVGWGADVYNEAHPVVSWMHLPIPASTGSISSFERLRLLRVFLLFQCSEASIGAVHIYDGNNKIQEFNDLSLQGNFLTKGLRNTFQLTNPYTVKKGIGLSFYFKPEIGTDIRETHPTLLVSAAGAEFEMINIFLSTVRIFVSGLSP
jgi:hypothetical protein